MSVPSGPSFVDTGFFVALMDPSGGLHARAMAWLRSGRLPMVTTEFVLIEVINHFSNPAKRRLGHRVIEMLHTADDAEVIPASPALFQAGLDLHRDRPDKAWSLTDCISFALMQQRNLQQALAYDHHFEQAGFEPLLRRDPS